MANTQFDTTLNGSISRPDHNLDHGTGSSTVLPSTVDLGNGYQGTVTPSSSAGYNADQFSTTINGGSSASDKVTPGTIGPGSLGSDDDKGGAGTSPDTTEDLGITNFPQNVNVDYDSLQTAMDDIMKALLSNNLLASGQMIGTFISNLQNYLKGNIKGLNNDEATQLTGQIYGIISNYLTAQYNNMYNRQNWLLENDYNSPKQQIARLIDAGINPAFYFGSMGNSNGGQIGDSQMSSQAIEYTPQSQLSDTGQKILSGITGAADLGSGIMGVVEGVGNFRSAMSTAEYNHTLAESARKKLPYELGNLFAQMGASFAASNLTGWQAKAIETTLPLTERGMSLDNTLKGEEIKNAQAQRLQLQTQAALNKVSCITALGNMDVAYKTLQQAWALGIMKNETERRGQNLQYSAAIKQINAAIANNDVNALVELLKTTTSSTEETWYTDNETGEEFSSTSSAGLKLGNDIAKLDMSVSSGQTFKVGNKTYTMNKRNSPHINFSLFDAVYRGLHYLKNKGYESDNETLLDPVKNNFLFSGVSHWFQHFSDQTDDILIDNAADLWTKMIMNVGTNRGIITESQAESFGQSFKDNRKK